MSERKVLNKYYPPDFDPSKIPRVRQPKNRQFTVRLMAPFNMKCKTCGEYIYKGKKFNARKEDVDNESYLGIRIYRFYIKCTRCLSEISFKTDPASTDYVIEAGATRNFMALKLAEEQALREVEAEKEEEKTNPMKLLENRTKASRGEIEMVETLEELKELNKRKVAINFDHMLDRYDDERHTAAELDQLDDELVIKSVFGERAQDGTIIKRLADQDSTSSDDDDRPARPPPAKIIKKMAAADPLISHAAAAAPAPPTSRDKLKSLIRIKKAGDPPAPPLIRNPAAAAAAAATAPAPGAKVSSALSLLNNYSASGSDDSN